MGGAATVQTGVPGALHGDGHAHRPDCVVIDADKRVFMFPVGHLPHAENAAVERRAGIDLIKVSRHHVAFLGRIAQTQLDRVHLQLFRQLIDGGFQRENTLRSAIAAVSAGGHDVGVDDIRPEFPETLRPVKRNGFVARRPTVVGPCSP